MQVSSSIPNTIIKGVECLVYIFNSTHCHKLRLLKDFLLWSMNKNVTEMIRVIKLFCCIHFVYLLNCVVFLSLRQFAAQRVQIDSEINIYTTNVMHTH